MISGKKSVRLRRVAALALAAAALSVVAAACGDDDDTAGSDTTAATGSTGGDIAQRVDAAQEVCRGAGGSARGEVLEPAAARVAARHSSS